MLAIAPAMAVLFSLNCIPNRGAPHRQDLFSVSLAAVAMCAAFIRVYANLKPIQTLATGCYTLRGIIVARRGRENAAPCEMSKSRGPDLYYAERRNVQTPWHSLPGHRVSCRGRGKR